MGEPFNPFGLFNRIFVPEALVRAKGISPGAKLTDRRLARYVGQGGNHHPKWTADPKVQARAELCPSFD
jgi:hypothetical protein